MGSSLGSSDSIIGVSTRPGQTALMRMPYGATSSAELFVIAISAALVAV
jgi:hypothetical protein